MLIEILNNLQPLQISDGFAFGNQFIQFWTLAGVDAWPGKQMHSHNYRVPEPFLDQVCVFLLVIYNPHMHFHG